MAWWISGLATGIGLVTDKYLLESTNFVDHYDVEMKPSKEQKAFINAAMYAGAILGMITFGPLSDFVGRRACLIACSFITFLGALLSVFAWSPAALIGARIITGIGMGGEYPLASSHSAESAKNSDNGARNVALLYLFGNGAGPALCALVAYGFDVAGASNEFIWRGIFGVGTFISFAGLLLRFFTTKDTKKFTRAVKRATGTRRAFFRYYWMPLLGTSLCWLLFDIVEYGLKQNDAAIFAADSDRPYRESILQVLATRLLVIPSLAIASWLVSNMSTKRVQFIGFLGCLVVNLILAIDYQNLKSMRVWFVLVYIVQLSFQSLPGVTTMAISAQIYPSAVRGTASAISAASGKMGAVIGSYAFTIMQADHLISQIFFTVVGTSGAGLVLTVALTPFYNGATLDEAEELAEAWHVREAREVLYGGPLEARASKELEDSDSNLSDSENEDIDSNEDAKDAS